MTACRRERGKLLAMQPARLCAVLLVLAAACHKASGEDEEDKPATALVTCKPIAAGEVEETLEVSGVIAPPPKVDAIVSSPVAGRVGKVAVEEGDTVLAGALLAVIEDPALPAGSLEARAQVASAQAAKTAADQELAREEHLVAAGISAKKDLDDARAKAAAAAADLDAARARAGLATAQLARRELRAPHAGVVLHLWKRTGESVDGTTATPVAEVADVSALELRAQLPPAQLARVRDGMPASVRVVGSDTSISATVTRVAPAVDTTTLLGTVRVQLASAAGAPVGSAASGWIVLGVHPGVLVPESALRRSMAGADEIVVCDHDVARVREVVVGSRSARGAEIAKGLTAGEQVVVDHALGLEEGQPLRH
jgi:RND family efflux transporter MFP subunit